MAVWGITCGLWDLRGPDEARYTQIAREILQNHHWLHLTVLGQPYDQKPPLAFWLFAAMLWLHDGVVSSGLLRLPSAIGATVVTLMTYLIGRRHWGRRAGMMAALMLATTVGFLDAAPTVELNMLYTTFTTLALFAWVNRPAPDVMPLSRVIGFWAALIAAFFVKGPLTFLIVLSALLWEAWSSRQWRRLRLLRPWAGVPVALALIAIWFLAEKSAFGQSFVAKQIGGETVGRFMQGAHSEVFWFYLPRLITSTAPVWSLLLIPAIVMAWRTRRTLPSPLPLLVGWMLPPFIVLTVANGKRESYLLPLMPAMALFDSWFAERWLAGKPLAAWLRGLLLAFPVAMALGLLYAVGIFATHPHKYEHQGFYFSSYMLIVWIVGAAGMLGMAYTGFRKVREWQHAIYIIAAVLLLGAFLEFSTVNPAIDPSQSTRPLAKVLQPILASRKEHVVGTFGRLAEAEYHVYGNYKVKKLKSKSFTANDPVNPNVILLTSQVANAKGGELNSSMLAAGYARPVSVPVSRETVLIYQRAAAR